MIDIPDSTYRKLTNFYGQSVRPWIDDCPRVIEQLARQWELDVRCLILNGMTSITLEASTRENERVMVKLVPERQRFYRELTTLTGWDSDRTPRLIEASLHHQALATSLVADQVGGFPPPANLDVQVASSLSSLHHRPLLDAIKLPDINKRTRDRLIPRLLGSQALQSYLGLSTVEDAVNSWRKSTKDFKPAATILHGDLYAANVLFSRDGLAYFIDPRGYIGPAVYDWCFWTIFYHDHGFDARLHLALTHSKAPPEVLHTYMIFAILDTIRYRLKHNDRDTANRLRTLLSHPFLSTCPQLSL